MCSCLTDFVKAIYETLKSMLAGSIPNGSAKVAGTVSSTVSTSSGSLTAGAVFASFDNTGATNVTVNGAVLKPGKFALFPTSPGMKLPAIGYDATSGELTINATIPPA